MRASYWTLLERLRRVEGELALDLMRTRKAPPARLIEIGGGSGWQAREFANAGYDVVSYDLANTQYADKRIYPVLDYDGHRLPEPDGGADVIFSSNVLEHIQHVVAFQAELLRILKPGGIALHILPSTSWRLWTSATHYPDVAQKVVQALAAKTVPIAGHRHKDEAASLQPSFAVPAEPRSRSRILANNLLPPRHGEFGNVITELYYFSRYRWSRLFAASGWRIELYTTNRLTYTGQGLMGDRLSLAARRRMSTVVGSACHVFVLRKA